MADPGASQSFSPPLPSIEAFGGSPLYVTGEDALAVTVNNAAAGVTVTITGRTLGFGQLRPSPFTQTLTPATDRSSSVVRFTLGDGWLLNAQVIVSAGTPAVGQTFARLSLVRGITANAVDEFTLAADYVTAKLPLSYPGSGVLRSTDGAGALRSITGATPAAGAEISETVPAGARWELIAFLWQLITGVAVANRTSRLVIDDGVNVLWNAPTTPVQPASLTINYAAAQGLVAGFQDTFSTNFTPIPFGVKLAAGFRLRTGTVNLQAADQYGVVRYLVREWIEGA
jgi:hypothetical protein